MMWHGWQSFDMLVMWIWCDMLVIWCRCGALVMWNWVTHCWCVIGWRDANVAHNWWQVTLCQCGGSRILFACMMTSPTYESDVIRIGNVPSSNMGTLVHAKQGILFGVIIFSCHFWKHHVKEISIVDLWLLHDGSTQGHISSTQGMVT